MVWCMIRTMGPNSISGIYRTTDFQRKHKRIVTITFRYKTVPKNWGRAEEDPEADIVFPKTILLAHAKPILWQSSKWFARFANQCWMDGSGHDPRYYSKEPQKSINGAPESLTMEAAVDKVNNNLRPRQDMNSMLVWLNWVISIQSGTWSVGCYYSSLVNVRRRRWWLTPPSVRCPVPYQWAFKFTSITFRNHLTNCSLASIRGHSIAAINNKLN